MVQYDITRYRYLEERTVSQYVIRDLEKGIKKKKKSSFHLDLDILVLDFSDEHEILFLVSAWYMYLMFMLATLHNIILIFILLHFTCSFLRLSHLQRFAAVPVSNTTLSVGRRRAGRKLETLEVYILYLTTKSLPLLLVLCNPSYP